MSRREVGWFVAMAVLTVPVAAEAQSVEQEIERALAAAPARARDGATVVRFKADHTWDVLREGTNRSVGYDRASDPGRPAFAVQCTSIANLERVAQNRRFDAEYPDRAERNEALQAAEQNGTRVVPEYGSMWLTMNGDSMDDM